MHRISARHPTLFALGFSLVLSLAVAACTPAPPPAGPKAQAQVKYATATPAGAAPSGAASSGATYSPALTTFATDDFSGSGQCVMCHSMLADASGASVSITDDWRSTMMANSSKDPVWQAKVASEVARNPHLTEVIEKKCGACHTPIAEGMVIHTRSLKVLTARKATVELLMAGHTGECVTDEDTHRCGLRKLADQLESGAPRFPMRNPRRYPAEELNPYVRRDMSKCILCRRCIGACREKAEKNVFSMAYRGFASKVIVDFDGPLTTDVCRDCGICVDYCPTGALSKPAKGGGAK
jgi:Pyruvate/2-oxoacid:ferredoxin oxidoreductase delta subunit